MWHNAHTHTEIFRLYELVWLCIELGHYYVPLSLVARIVCVLASLQYQYRKGGDAFVYVAQCLCALHEPKKAKG